MITKFRSLERDNYLEFERESNTVLVNIYDIENNEDQKHVILKDNDLFDLIWQLLRIQSEIRKESEVKNG